LTITVTSKNGCQKEENCGVDLTKGNPMQKATQMAEQGACDAIEAAKNQIPAADKAAQQAKQIYAEKALDAAKIAEAALISKRQFLEQLMQELSMAEQEYIDEENSLKYTMNSVSLASKEVQEAKDLLCSLENAMRIAEQKFKTAQEACISANEDFDKLKNQSGGMSHLERLSRLLAEAREDYEKTKQDAYRALCSAIDAKNRVSQKSCH